jgi:hypothetical protein
LSQQNIPKRISTAILQSLAAGVVPRVGLEHIAVGRKEEITAILHDLDDIVASGGASFRLILGRYGSGKSFLAQLIRNYAFARGFVVADADLSPTTRLTGTNGQGVALYRELLKNLATRTRPDGNAFAAILERWINDVQQTVIQDGVSPSDAGFNAEVESKIHATIRQMEEMVHGFDFASVLTAYWQGHVAGDDTRKNAALRWLRAEYATKTEAREALGVRVIIDDETYYDYLKLLARFVTDIGYKGLVLFIDEAVNLYKISNTVSRNNNYERLLTIFNDILQGKAQHIGVIMGATPQMVEDRQRGLFSYDALRSRLEESSYAKKGGLRDLSGPMIRLDVLTDEEIFLLLHRVRDIHAQNHGYKATITDDQITAFIDKSLERIGADQLLTPREVVRDFTAILNILQQNPDTTFETLVGELQPMQSTADPEALTPGSEISDDNGEFSTFTV